MSKFDIELAIENYLNLSFEYLKDKIEVNESIEDKFAFNITKTCFSTCIKLPDERYKDCLKNCEIKLHAVKYKMKF